MARGPFKPGWLECVNIPRSVIPTGGDHREGDDLRSGGTLCLVFASDDGWPIQAVFWLEWGSSTAGCILLRFAEQQLNMLRPDYVPVNPKPVTAPQVPYPKIALFATLGWGKEFEGAPARGSSIWGEVLYPLESAPPQTLGQNNLWRYGRL